MAEHRAIRIRVAGEARVAAAEDAARYRDALGAAVPRGLPGAFTDPVPRTLGALGARFARTHGPFTAAEVTRRLGIPADATCDALVALEAAGRVVHGAFRPGGAEREWCDVGVLRDGRLRHLEVQRVDGAPVRESAAAPALRDRGFTDSYRGLTLHP